jgi:hypothetical protein
MDDTLRTPILGVLEAHGIVFEPCEGIGTRQRRRRCSDPAMVAVAMRPAVFLRLSPPLATPWPSLGWILTRIPEGHAICPRMLPVCTGGLFMDMGLFERALNEAECCYYAATRPLRRACVESGDMWHRVHFHAA